MNDITLSPNFALRMLASPDGTRRMLENQTVANYPWTTTPQGAKNWLQNLAVPAKVCDRSLRESIERGLRQMRNAHGRLRRILRHDINRQVRHLTEIYRAEALAAQA